MHPSTGLSPPVKYFTDRSKVELLLWIVYVFLSCVCYALVHVCWYVPCGHMLGKGWPLNSRLWCLTVSLLLSFWYPGSCGTWLYRFLIFAPLLNFIGQKPKRVFFSSILFCSIYRCPVYYNLPPQCSLVKKGNACCLEPVCDFKGTYGTTNGQNVGKYNGVSKYIGITY